MNKLSCFSHFSIHSGLGRNGSNPGHGLPRVVRCGILGRLGFFLGWVLVNIPNLFSHLECFGTILFNSNRSYIHTLIQLEANEYRIRSSCRTSQTQIQGRTVLEKQGVERG